MVKTIYTQKIALRLIYIMSIEIFDSEKNAVLSFDRIILKNWHSQMIMTYFLSKNDSTRLYLIQFNSVNLFYFVQRTLMNEVKIFIFIFTAIIFNLT